MSCSNTTLTSLFFLLIFLFKLNYSMGSNGIQVLCPEIEKQSLLSFKQGLNDPGNLMSSWDGEVDCCKWKGVVCDNFTGHVHQLHLQDQWWYYGSAGRLSGKINSSLLNLKHLRYLDLSYNNFTGETIPSFIGSLTNLEYLDLSYSGFEGKIPSITNATKLKYIDLSGNHFNSSIPNWLYFCKGLEYVDLSYNLLEGTISDGIANLTSLNTLNLNHNQLSGEIPDSFAKLSSLMYLGLSHNNLSGNLPESIGQLFNLIKLGIRENMLMSGVVTETYFANLTNLEYFSASGNHLMSLKVSPDWIPPINLTTLLIGSWTLLGPSNHIPLWLHTRNNISELDLSNTGISGNVPPWLWEIYHLDLSNNHLHGNIPYIGAQYMYLSSNQFNGSLPQIGDGVEELDLSNNSFSGGISHFLCDTTHQNNKLGILHLGGNQLSGELPRDCWTKWSSLRYLNLGNNNMFGTIPSSIGLLRKLMSLNLYGNNFSGQISPSLHNCTYLVKIDLSDNNLHGNIPTQMGTSLVELTILILHSNKLSGKLSSKLCHLNSLQILDLSNNNFSGVIPTCVYNFTAMATKSSVFIAYVYILGTTSSLYYSYSRNLGISFMESVSVAAKGSELQYDTVLSLVTNINLSKNKFSGGIPKELESLVELQSLNLSKNQLTGSIPDNIGDMKQLQSLDLSTNFLSGHIPNTLGHMSFLSYLNLSYNNLTGKIPQGTQLQILDASSFIGNHLYGPPLTSNCSHCGGDEVIDEDEEDEGDESDAIEWFWVFLSSGYAMGLSVVCSALVLKKSWRDAYFGFMEEMWNKFYVYVHIKWARFNL